MPTKTCDQCHGVGQLATGTYANCGSCGGRGYAGHTNVACMSCGGTGLSTMEKQETCWKCHGTGSIHEPDTYSSPKPYRAKTSTSRGAQTTSKAKPKTKPVSAQSDSDLTENIGLISIIIAMIGAFLFAESATDVHPIALGVCIFIGSFVSLLITYYAIKIGIFVLKMAFALVFYGGMLIVICAAMDMPWAQQILSAI